MKKKVIALCLVVILLSMLGSGTLAYYSAKAAAHNVITTSGVDITLVEKTRKPDATLEDFPREGISGVMPGDAISKQVFVENNEESAWVRLKVTKAILLDGKQTSLDTALIGLDINTADWTDGGDGWYYYKTPVDKGGRTTNLFTTVTFSGPAMDNAYQGCAVHLNVQAQAVQSANNALPASGDYTKIPGWPEAE